MLASAAGRASAAIISRFKSFKNAGFNTFSKIYNSHVIPIMDYSSGIWGYSKSEEVDNIQNRATKYYLGVYQRAHIFAIQGDIGWTRSKVRQQVAMLRLWNKLSQMSEDRLTKNVFNWDYNLCKNWSYEIKEIFYSINMQQIYNTKYLCNIVTFEAKCKELDEYQWLLSLTTKPKLRTYIEYKQTFGTDEYVKYCLSRRGRSLIAQTRISILPLHIETDRFRNVKLENRTCQVCKNNDTENEFHFISICNVYTEFRNAL